MGNDVGNFKPIFRILAPGAQFSRFPAGFMFQQQGRSATSIGGPVPDGGKNTQRECCQGFFVKSFDAEEDGDRGALRQVKKTPKVHLREAAGKKT